MRAERFARRTQWKRATGESPRSGRLEGWPAPRRRPRPSRRPFRPPRGEGLYRPSRGAEPACRRPLAQPHASRGKIQSRAVTMTFGSPNRLAIRESRRSEARPCCGSRRLRTSLKMTQSRLRHGPPPYRATERAGSFARAGGPVAGSMLGGMSRRGRAHGVDERE